MECIVFYSWQSDLPNAANRAFIQRALDAAAAQLASDDTVAVEPVIDRDTEGLPGSPNIASAIFEKIAQAHVFVADVTIINPGAQRPAPNPNVLIELGYALHRHGWDRTLMVMNTAFGVPEQLPFDLLKHRVIRYHSPADASERVVERTKLQRMMESAIRSIVGRSSAQEDRATDGTLPEMIPVLEALVSAVDRELTALFGDRLELDAARHAVDELASTARNNETRLGREMYDLLNRLADASHQVWLHLRMRDGRDIPPSARDTYDNVARQQHNLFIELRAEVVRQVRAFRARHPNTPTVAAIGPVGESTIIDPIASALSQTYDGSLSVLQYLEGPDLARSDSLAALDQAADALSEVFERQKHQLDAVTRHLIDYCIRYVRGMVSYGFDGNDRRARESCQEFHEQREKVIRRFATVLGHR